MCSMHLLGILLLLLACSKLSAGQNSPDSVSAILKSYADSFSTPTPDRKHYQITTAPIVLGISKNQQAQRRIIVPVEPSVEVKDSEYKSLDISGDSTSVESNDDSFANLSDESSDVSEDPKGPPDHVIPYSVHENPEEPPTRPNYTVPGEWAKPPPEKNVVLEFIPTKLYAQVRGTHTIKHLPIEDALSSAQNSEEKENAARLKEVLKESKSNTVYTEEGYEDSAYDHAGQIRDADFHEGFAKKTEAERDKGKVPKSKKKKSRKNKSYESEDFSEDYSDHLDKIGEEARTSQRQVRSDEMKALKKSIKSAVINPKKIAEDGIFRLEEDLKRESIEAQRTSTEEYYTTTAAPLVVAETTNKNEYETTTIKRDVYTIRPRKFITTVKASNKPFLNKSNKPSKFHAAYKNDPSVYTDVPITETPTTLNYGNQVWQYLVKHNQTPTINYEPYTEAPTLKSVVANPLAVATVNGHGPYLVLVTAAPDMLTPSSLESDSLESTVNYRTIPFENSTESYEDAYDDGFGTNLLTQNDAIVNPPVQYAPNYVNDKVLRGSNLINKQTYNNNKISAKSFKFPNSNYYDRPQQFLIRPKNKNVNFYTVMLPPQIANKLHPRPDYACVNNNRNVLNQWSVTRDNVEPVESMHHDTQQSYNEPAIKTTALPVSRLLPPSPLSSSEYASFLMNGRKSKPIPPIVLNMMPVIDAIQKHEKRPTSYFPFLFRRRRSTSLEDYKKQISNRRRKNIGSAVNEKTPLIKRSVTARTKYPANLQNLLNEAPKVAVDVVNKEIDARFKNDTKDVSAESLGADESTENNGENIIEAEVPEVDLSASVEEEDDESDATTEKPVVDTKKFPFYKKSEDIRNTAMEYAENPDNTPRKTLGGMEFYDSRKLECEELEPNLEKLVPENEELDKKLGPRHKKPRLHGLGDKMDCYKTKFFDKNPLDNPLFIEEKIESPSAPVELNPRKFASRILDLPSEKDDYVIPRGPKQPEHFRPMMQKKPQYRSTYYTNYNKKYAPRMKKPVNSYYHHTRNDRQPPSMLDTEENRIQPNKTRVRIRVKNHKSNQDNKSKRPLPFERYVYEDVMGTIKSSMEDPVYKNPGPPYKHKRMPRPRKQENNNKKEKSKEYERDSYMPAKIRSYTIEGLVPPSRNAIHTVSFKSPPKIWTKSKKSRVNFDQAPIYHTRILKRSIKENKTNINSNASAVNSEKKPVKKKLSTFRIVVMTPPTTEIEKRKRAGAMNVLPVTPNESRGNISFNESEAYSVDIRRKEPRYKVQFRNKLLNNTSSNVSEPNNTTSPSISGSTFVPVTVQPNDSFSTQMPQESNVRFNARKLRDSRGKNQYKVHETAELNDNIDVNTNDPLNLTDASKTIHKELYDFLEGEPPGYEKNFSDEKKPDSQGNDSEETTQKGDLNQDDEDYDEEAEQLDDEESVPQGEETKAEDKADVDTYSGEEAEDNSDKGSNETDSEPFTRFSSRPDSHPEYFEDEKYADLGPRVNKPYFYHPPFEVPDYEKQPLNKAVDDTEEANGDDYGHDQSEDHERYAFPWENDDEEDSSKEESAPERYEYPWERRERKKKERLKKQRLKNKHSKRNVKKYQDDECRQYKRNKKDVNNVEISPANKPASKFSSKYKSNKKKESSESSEEGTDHDDHYDYSDEEFISTNSDNIKQSILKFIKEIEDSKPKSKTTVTNKTLTNDTLTASSNTTLPDDKKLVDAAVERTNAEPVKIQHTSRNATEPPVVTTTQPQFRRRIWRNKANLTNVNDLTKSGSTPVDQQISNPTTSKYGRYRGRVRGMTSTVAPTLTTTAYSSNIVQRRRNRSTARSLVATTTAAARTSSERRRRQFRTPVNVIASRNATKTVQIESTTLPSVLTSTIRTMEHRRKISKEHIVTETKYDDDDDDEYDRSDEGANRRISRTKPVTNSKLTKSTKTKSVPSGEHAKKENVEKVTITMEETPDHVYKTKEVDKNGVKGKFVTITANNNNHTDNETAMTNGLKDEEIEEMKKKMDSFDPYSQQQQEETAEKSKKMLKSYRKTTNDSVESKDDLSEEEEEDSSAADSRENERGEDESSSSFEEISSNESGREEVEEAEEEEDKEEDEKKKQAVKDSMPINIIKDPSSRRYFYVE